MSIDVASVTTLRTLLSSATLLGLTALFRPAYLPVEGCLGVSDFLGVGVFGTVIDFWTALVAVFLGSGVLGAAAFLWLGVLGAAAFLGLGVCFRGLGNLFAEVVP